ncbi:hypothetical protein LJC56_09830 [Christensenellaceae bacterium OttesenSCG-928-K19]|nr:hypothetical protein [Christensenellaceae bacterium OttesenSCG-928-K19]
MKHFSIGGFVHFYRSLIRFNHTMSGDKAAEFTWRLYTANLASSQSKTPDKDTGIGWDAFLHSINKSTRRPYHTVVQLYRAMEALALNIDVKADDLSFSQLCTFVDMLHMMDDIELRFYRAFNMRIDDGRTIYSECPRSITPSADEPRLCLMRDWASLDTM